MAIIKAAPASLWILLNLKNASVLSEIPNKRAPIKTSQNDASVFDLKLAAIAIPDKTTPYTKYRGRFGVLLQS